LVFTILIPKEISVGTFRYDFFGGKPYFPQKGGNGPLFEEKGGTSPLFDTASPPFAENRSSRQISNTDQKYRLPNKFDTSKIPIPKKLLATPWYTTLIITFGKKKCSVIWPSVGMFGGVPHFVCSKYIRSI
jgi:hypothetical protein